MDDYPRPRSRAHKLARVKMLCGFSVSVGSRVLEENAWRLKNAAALVKLLALARATASIASR
jgi:hypothetical protein